MFPLETVTFYCKKILQLIIYNGYNLLYIMGIYIMGIILSVVICVF